MTSGITLAGGGTTVDFDCATVRNATVTHRFANPVIKLPTPIKTTDNQGTNVIIINIGFLNDSFDFSFTFTDGPGTFDWKTPGSTNYEKLQFLAHYVGIKTLTLNGTALTGHIENAMVPFRPGQKDLSINGSFSFNLAKNIVMA